MKRVLIISPYFPPSNAADMQRVRMSLPYFKDFGWEAEVVCVDQKHSEMLKDDLLLQSLPANQVIYQVDAFDKKWTGKLGLGSLALRSMWFYFKEVNRLLSIGRYDLIYFSTTQFPVGILGSYWKRKFGVPYVIDMQDPWHSDYYQDKPKNQRPKKYWFSYRLNKWLEPVALKTADGLISVSDRYISDLKLRYPQIKTIPAATITFGYFEPDLAIALANKQRFKYLLDEGKINLVYVGRGGADLHKAIAPLFKAMKLGITKQPALFKKLRLYFIGTSYAPKGQGQPTILPLAREHDLENYVTEITDRISYYHTLTTLQQANALIIPGSDDAKYTASKIYPYLLTKKPLLAIFHQDSSAVDVLKSCTRNSVILTLADDKDETEKRIYQTLANWAGGLFTGMELTAHVTAFDAKNLTGMQVKLFEQTIKKFEGKN